MNKVMMEARCLTIRDQQLNEKKEIEVFNVLEAAKITGNGLELDARNRQAETHQEA